MLQVIVADVENVQVHQTPNRLRQTLDFVFAQAEHGQLVQAPDLLADVADAVEAQVERRQVSQLVDCVGNIFAYKVDKIDEFSLTGQLITASNSPSLL